MKKSFKSVDCDYCHKPAELVTGATIYPHRDDLARLRFWRCVPCEAYVGCHKAGDGTTPLGRLANLELRKAKNAAHRAFDPMWQGGKMARKPAYAWLAGMLGIEVKDCHIGRFDVAQCQAVVAACEKEAA